MGEFETKTSLARTAPIDHHGVAFAIGCKLADKNHNGLFFTFQPHFYLEQYLRAIPNAEAILCLACSGCPMARSNLEIWNSVYRRLARWAEAWCVVRSVLGVSKGV